MTAHSSILAWEIPWAEHTAHAFNIQILPVGPRICPSVHGNMWHQTVFCTSEGDFCTGRYLFCNSSLAFLCFS